ncbi:MAG: SnoaL-like domain-containing protein [Paracoccaceae bacterium]
MTNSEIGQRLVELCRAHDEVTALNELYHPDAVSIESMVAPGADSRETHGLEGIRGKHAWWDSTMEMHSASVDGPFPHGDDRFAVIFEADVTDKNNGTRFQMKEVAVYHTADGKIRREEFFYST